MGEIKKDEFMHMDDFSGCLVTGAGPGRLLANGQLLATYASYTK